MGLQESENFSILSFFVFDMYREGMKFIKEIKQTSFYVLKEHSCKLYNNKNIIASTQITNTEIFAFIEKTIETVKKQATF